MNKLTTLIAAGLLSLGAGAASAATDLFTNGGCLTSDVTSGGGSADDCYGLVQKDGPGGINDSASLLNDSTFNYQSVSDWRAGGTSGFTNGLFGESDWSFGGKVDGFGRVGDLTVGDGTFSWAGDVYSQMVVVLKQAGSFSTYLFDGGVSGDGTWDTTEAVFGNNAGGISHLSIYYRDGGGTSVVPLPAAGFLLIAGFGGLMALRRKR